MPYEETHTFGATDILGLATADFEFVSNEIAGSKDSAIPKDAGGEFIPAAHATFNEKDEFTANYVAKKVGAVTPPAIVLGEDKSGYHITGAKLGSTNTGHVTLAVSAHKHIGGQAGTAHKVNKHTIVWPDGVDGFGAFDPFAKGEVSSGVPVAQLQSSSYDVSIEHVDAQDHKGEFLVGRSQGVKVEASLEAVTDVKTVADPTGWKIVGRDVKEGNEGFHGLSLRGEMYPGTAWATE